jgi:signal transduction histidine kinase/ActR/RegA family two-component response regulator
MAIGSGRLRQRFFRAPEAAGAEAGVMASPSDGGARRLRQVQAAEIRLLYENAYTGIVVTFLIAALLAYAQRGDVSGARVVAWLLYMMAVSVARALSVRRYFRAPVSEADNDRWRSSLVIGAALAAAGWAAAALILYNPARPTNETFLVFVVGGVMLGGASLLAARPEVFLTFLLPTGLVTALRLASVGDEGHLMMGFLGALFTAATVTTTWRFHRTIESSLNLRFDKEDLIESLRTEKSHSEALNKDLERRVSERTAQLMEADRRKDEFLATIAHELRNPLAPIRLAVESLKAGAHAESALRARDVIDRQVRQLVRLVDDLLDVSRITANKIHLRRDVHDLSRLIATAVESITPLAAAAQQQLDVRTPGTAMHVDGDGARLVQILANVLHNAVKFTPHGGRISLTAEEDSGEAVVRIRDTGIGIAAEDLPRMFDMFQQAAPILERSAGGLGIGLTLARRLVEMHEGRITISSPGRDQGTEVEIRLPLSPVTPAQIPSNEPSSRVEGTRALRVLIVEDNPDAADMLELLVKELGHATRVARDGGAAIAAAIEFAPDVVFLDIGLPVLNGYDVARRLRERAEFSGVHIAAVTGWGQDEDRRKAREAGFDSHFTKPLAPAALQNLLATIARRPVSPRAPGSTPRTRLTDTGGLF